MSSSGTLLYALIPVSILTILPSSIYVYEGCLNKYISATTWPPQTKIPGFAPYCLSLFLSLFPLFKPPNSLPKSITTTMALPNHKHHHGSLKVNQKTSNQQEKKKKKPLEKIPKTKIIELHSTPTHPNRPTNHEPHHQHCHTDPSQPPQADPPNP